jgi:hypothetical protein
MEDSGGNGKRHTEKEREKERKGKVARVAQRDTHDDVCCMDGNYQLLVGSLGRVCPSFSSHARKGGRQNAIEDSVTGSLSLLERES